MAKYIGENSLAELVTKTKQLVATKQNILPTTSTAGKVLKSTATAGTVEWGDISKDITEITTQYVRITDLDTGIYKLTYNGTKYIYYNGATSTSTTYASQANGSLLLFVNKSNVTLNSEVWNWFCSDAASTWQSLRFGYTTKSSGSASAKYFDALWSAVPSASTNKRYLLGSSSTTSSGTINTNASCYMQNGKLYSNGNEVQEKLTAGTGISISNNTISVTSSGGITVNDLLTYVYPVGSVYLSVSQTSPASFLGGTWTALAGGKALWTTTTANTGGYTLNAGLPNITGTFIASSYQTTVSGAFTSVTGYDYDCPKGGNNGGRQFTFSASGSNSIYGNSTTVQPPAIRVYAWKRTA